MSTGFAVVNSTASSAIRSAFSSIFAASATSQPPILGTALKVRVRTTSSLRAVTEKLGFVCHDSCSMYEPSLDAKYFHS